MVVGRLYIIPAGWPSIGEICDANSHALRVKACLRQFQCFVQSSGAKAIVDKFQQVLLGYNGGLDPELFLDPYDFYTGSHGKSEIHDHLGNFRAITEDCG